MKNEWLNNEILSLEQDKRRKMRKDYDSSITMKVVFFCSSYLYILLL